MIYHGGGLLVGSADIIPKPQIAHLAQQGFVVVIPNYRLAPQVSGKQAFSDCEEAYEWASTVLPDLMKSEHDVLLTADKIVAMGHSSGGTIALHLASCKNLKAVTAFYPSLFNADPSTTAHKPTSVAPFGAFPDFEPNDEDWASIKPAGVQLSEALLARPGANPAPRNRWQMHLLKSGQWLATVLPDGDYAAIDPMTRLANHWPPVMIVQGEADNVPGSSLELAERAEKAMKDAGVKEVRLERLPEEAHMFDLPPTVGTEDLGPRWQAVVKGLDWLISHV